MMHPELEEGDFLYVGVSDFSDGGRKQHFSLTYKRGSDNRTIVPAESVATMNILGIPTSEHWYDEMAQKGHRGSSYTEYHEHPSYDLPEITPRVEAIIARRARNTDAKSLLQLEY